MVKSLVLLVILSSFDYNTHSNCIFILSITILTTSIAIILLCKKVMEMH